MLSTAVTELLGCRVPVQQAPMGTVSTPALASAVARAGGIGSVAAWGKSAEQVEALVDRLDAGPSGALAVNFAGAEVDHDAVRAAARRVRVVDFFWFDPDPELVALAQGEGARVCWQVGSPSEAEAAVLAGCDLIAVQGVEAGGHVRGTSTLLPLLSAVLESTGDVPVLAAGGIADPRSLAAVLAAGAAGARVGTAFVATTESGAHPAYRAALVAADGRDTEVSDAFALCPLCATSPRARVLTSAVEAVRASADDVVGELTTPQGVTSVPSGSGMPATTAFSGRVEATALYAGTGTGSIHDVVPAGVLLDRLVSGAERLLRAW